MTTPAASTVAAPAAPNISTAHARADETTRLLLDSNLEARMSEDELKALEAGMESVCSRQFCMSEGVLWCGDPKDNPDNALTQEEWVW